MGVPSVQVYHDGDLWGNNPKYSGVATKARFLNRNGPYRVIDVVDSLHPCVHRMVACLTEPWVVHLLITMLKIELEVQGILRDVDVVTGAVLMDIIALG